MRREVGTYLVGMRFGWQSMYRMAVLIVEGVAIVDALGTKLSY